MVYNTGKSNDIMYTLITGGSSGIGKATAFRLAKKGHHLLLVSNDQAALQETQKEIKSIGSSISVKTYFVDLTSDQGCQDLFEYTQRENLTIHILINNAGLGTYGFYHQVDTAKEIKMIELNILAVYKLTRLFLQEMNRQNRGHIINIASIAGFQPGPKLAAYSATKSFVLNYSRALNYELKMENAAVRITTICPNPVNTNFAATAKMETSSLFDSWLTITADDVALAIEKSLTSKKDMIIPKKRFHLLNKISRRLPTSWLLKITADQTQ